MAAEKAFMQAQDTVVASAQRLDGRHLLLRDGNEPVPATLVRSDARSA
jgi:hypothetical protein